MPKARKSRARKSTVLILSSLLALGFGSRAHADENLIKIVSSLPRTGSANAQTTTMVNGIRLAIAEAGSKAGDFNLVYEDWDDASPERGQWDPAVEAANADKAIKDLDVMVYVGPYNSGAAKISMPKLNAANLVDVNPSASWPGLTKPGKGEANEPQVYRPTNQVTFFRVVPADDIQGLVGAEWASELGAKKVFIIHDRELYGKGIAEMFKKSAPQFKLDIVGFEGIDAKASNYKTLVTKIRQQRPDLVYFGGTTQSNAGQFAKDLAGAGLAAKLMVPDGCFENAFIEAAGKDNLEGKVFITFGGVPPKELKGKGRDFYEAYKKMYNAEPEAYAVYGYEAAKVAIDAIRRVGKKDRRAILEAVRSTKDYDGALGKWSFDANGDTSLRTMSGNTVKNGQFEFVKILGS